MLVRSFDPPTVGILGLLKLSHRFQHGCQSAPSVPFVLRSGEVRAKFPDTVLTSTHTQVFESEAESQP